MMSKNTKMEDNNTDSFLLHIDVRPRSFTDKKLVFHVNNIIPDNLYLYYGKTYTFKTINPFPNHPFYIGTERVGATRRIGNQSGRATVL